MKHGVQPHEKESHDFLNRRLPKTKDYTDRLQQIWLGLRASHSPQEYESMSRAYLKESTKARRKLPFIWLSRSRRHEMHKFIASKAFGIVLNLACFALAFAGTCVSFFMLSVPIFLIGLPVALFAKSQRAKEIAASCLMAPVAIIVIYLADDIVITPQP